MKISKILKRSFALLSIAILLFQNSACFAVAEPENFVNGTCEQSLDKVLSKNIVTTYDATGNDENSFFYLLFRMNNMRRWNNFRVIKDESLVEHSLFVAMIAHELALIENTEFGGNLNADYAAVLGMYHDALETLTGDVITPTKHFNKQMEDCHGKVEHQAGAETLSMLPEKYRETFSRILMPTKEEKNEDMDLWKLVKAADTISVVIKCLQEQNMGNRDLDNVLEDYTKRIMAIEDPAVVYFIKTFLPSFGFKCPDEVTADAPVAKSEC